MEPERRAAQAPPRLFGQIEDACPDAMLLLADDELIDVNPAFLQLFGYDDPSVLAGRSFLEMVLPEDRTSVKAEIRRILRDEGGPDPFLAHCLRSDGIAVQVEARISSVTLDGRRHLLGVIREAAPRDLAQGLPLLETERGALLSEENYRSVIENASDAVYLLKGSRFVFVNPRFEEMLGFDREEVTDPGFSILEVVAPESRPLIDERRTARLSGEDVPVEYEFTALRKDGSRILVSVRNVALPDPEDLMVLGIVRDITEERQAEIRIARQDAVLRAINEIFGEALTCETEEEVARTCLALAEKLTGSRFGFIGEMNQAGSFDTIALSDPGWDACTMPESTAAVMIKNMKVRGIWSRVLKEEQSQIINNPATHPHRVGIPKGHPPITCFLGVPLKHGGRTFGLIGLANKESGYDLGDQEAIEALSVAFVEALMRKRAEEGLRLTQFSLDRASIAVFWVEPDARLFYVNETACRTLGYSREELCNMTVHDIDPDFPKEAWAAHWRELKERGSLTLESRHRSKDGRCTPVEITANYLDYGGRQFNIAFALDIAERKKAEEALRRSEAGYRSLVQNAVCGIYRSSVEGKFLDVNLALVRMLGYDSREELLAADLATDIYQDPKERESRIAAVSHQDIIAGSEVKWKRRDGSPITLWLSGRTLRDESGGLLGFEVIAEDVTERRNLEAQLHQTQRLESIGQLAGGVAHDFNNLLTVICGQGDLALARLEPDHALHPKLQEIRRAAERAKNLTRQLLAFSRRQMLQVKQLNLSTALRHMGEMLRRLIGEDIHLEVLPGADLWPVKADPVQIEQVIMNLVVNARDAMPRGGVLTLETENVVLDQAYASAHLGERPGRHVTLSVSDTGEGMPPDVQEKIFEPFFTTKDQGKGTGLGLATVYGIVKQSGGSINVHSEVGSGSTFKVYFPAGEEEPDPLTPSSLEGGASGETERILLVEDEEGVREYAAEVLKDAGYEVLVAVDGIEAIEVAREHSGELDLLLTDVVMPRLGGKGVFDALTPGQPGMKVLYMSGYTENAIVHHGVLVADTNFLGKPFSPRDLESKVREVLRSVPVM